MCLSVVGRWAKTFFRYRVTMMEQEKCALEVNLERGTKQIRATGPTGVW